MNAMMVDDDQVVWELIGEELMAVVNDQQKHGLPPGFRFHPTDEELVTFYLVSKVFGGGFSFCGVNIVEVDLNRCEPWELPEVAKMGEREWYFFSLRDRKYPTGLRTNRSTGAGYWKATGKDREVHAAITGSLVGMKKTLVFYKGRAPRGEKTKWVLHEYRLEGDYSCRHTCKEEWVICRIFNKSSLVERGGGGAESHHKDNNNNNNNQSYYLDPSPSTPTQYHTTQNNNNNSLPPLPDLQTLDSPIQSLLQNNPFLHHHHNPNPNPNLYPLPSSINWGPPQYCQQQLEDQESTDLISNWQDFAYLYNPTEFYELALANFGGVGGGGGSSSLATVHEDLCLLGPTNAPQFGPMVP